MASRACINLERPVAFVTAAKKLAKVRGDVGAGGGWIKDARGNVICQGWDTYGQRMVRMGLLCQDAEHEGGNGKWYVWYIGLTSEQLLRAEALFGRKATS